MGGRNTMQKISSATSQPLIDVAGTRCIEQLAAATLPPQTLMQRAGLAVARLTLALAPHARCIWVACGPGNNGGDGFEAALQLHQWGKTVVVTWTGGGLEKTGSPPDAEAARQRALAGGVRLAEQPPSDFDFCIDALLGIGARLDPSRPGAARMQQWLQVMHASPAARLAVDVPTGLDADTGVSSPSNATLSIAKNDHSALAGRIFTLSLLTLKPGLFTASGRDLAGEVWLDDLDVHRPVTLPTNETPDSVSSPANLPCAWLLGADHVVLSTPFSARHASHKGSFGDVAVLGGESTAHSHMAGAALLAARAALHAGAGRVFVALLTDPQEPVGARLTVDVAQPELMFRSFDALDMKQQVMVCGCGGGQAVLPVLARVLSTASRLVLDADALNAIAQDKSLQTLLTARHRRDYSTVLTPHPLEAARLAGITTAEVQANRLTAAKRLADQFQCIVVLKGSGSIVAAPGQTSRINSSGNALLATAGTGDVLAGMVGAGLARGSSAFEGACSAVFLHGHKADDWASRQRAEQLTASMLASA